MYFMARVYVIHYNKRLPTQIPPDVAKNLKEAIEKFLKENPDVKYNGTMWDPKTGIAICDWEGNKEKIENFMKQLNIPYDEVVEVQPLSL